MKKGVVTFGEIMLRLSPPLYNRIEQTVEFSSHYGGGEANVAVSLENLGEDVVFVTKLPKNQLGDGAIKYLSSHGVDVSHIVQGEENIGIYFLEHGFGGRPSRVIYNRKNSAFTTIQPYELDLDELFQDAKWFHFSGITLALSESVRMTTLAALKKAKEYHVTVSFDFNYRSKLWTIDEAREAIQVILPYIDVCFASEFDINKILNHDVKGVKYPTRDELMKSFAEEYGIDYIFGTDREIISANENILSAYVYMKDGHYQTGQYRVQIVDRVGAGDAFASGVIYGLLQDYTNFYEASELGLAIGVLKHTIFGDSSIFKLDEVKEFIHSNGRTTMVR